jgi:hypothetical protein
MAAPLSSAAANTTLPALPTKLTPAALSPSSSSSYVSSYEDAAARLVARMLAGPTVNRVGETSWRDRNDAVRDFFEWMASAERNGGNVPKLRAMLVQFTPAVLQQFVSRAADKSTEDARRARLSFFSLLFTICNRIGDASYSKRTVEAGILPVCAAITREAAAEDAAAQVQYGDLLLLSLRLLSRVMVDLFGSHPFLSAGAMLRLMFRALSKAQDRSLAVKQAEGYLKLFSDTSRCAIDHRPVIPARAAARIMQAASQPMFAFPSPLAPIHRVDSDSLCIISSFLCGCDFLRVIRVCRRWSGLRLKPTAWPDPHPCDTHIDEYVATFYGMLHQCTPAFPTDREVRCMLEHGVLSHLLLCLEADRPSVSALNLLQHIGWSDDCAHAALLVSRGIIGKLGKLIRRHGEDAVRRRACGVLAAVLYGSTAVAVDAAVQDGLIPVLVAFPRANGGGHEVAMQALTYMCLRGNDAHRRALVAGNVIPLLMEVARHGTPRSSGVPELPPERNDRLKIDALLDLLRALSLLLRAARETNVQCIWRADATKPVLKNWRPDVRDEVFELLRECSLSVSFLFLLRLSRLNPTVA